MTEKIAYLIDKRCEKLGTTVEKLAAENPWTTVDGDLSLCDYCQSLTPTPTIESHAPSCVWKQAFNRQQEKGEG